MKSKNIKTPAQNTQFNTIHLVAIKVVRKTTEADYHTESIMDTVESA